MYPVAMANAGQICLAARRVFVPAQMYDAFCDELARFEIHVRRRAEEVEIEGPAVPRRMASALPPAR